MTQVATMLPEPPEGVRWTSRSLSVTDPSLTLERYAELLSAVGEVKTASSFWIGDLINFGDLRYGERYAQAIDASGLSYATLSNYAYVCGRIAPSRRREGLRFGHHAEVASLEPAAQDEWLAKADEGGWTREQLRDAVRTAGLMQPRTREPKVPAAREVLDGVGVVEATRDLGVVREALEMTRDALGGATVAGLEERLPGALRALDEVGRTVTAAARKMARPSLVEAGRRLVADGREARRESTRSSGFAMVPGETFDTFFAALEAFATALDQEGK